MRLARHVIKRISPRFVKATFFILGRGEQYLPGLGLRELYR
jgi:hypothetical protein